MARITKEYYERKNEILDAAQELFLTQGYEKTSVDNIIKKVGVAKGTFYYYFKSKEDLLDKLVKRMTDKIQIEIKKIVEKKDLDAINKLEKAYSIAGNIKLENIHLIKLMLKILYEKDNLILRYKIYKSNVELLVPEFAKIIEQGVKEKLFNTPYPYEAAKLFFELGWMLGDTTSKLFLELDEKPENMDKIVKEIEVYEDAMERILGAKKGTINIVNREMLKNFQEKLKK
ncbi:MAG: TetR/AcrR family transcriptional regulator [Atribacteria sp.]|nr:TetR/AcrR family transcriptional regulator [Candidatus Atribacteria bacterium]